MKNELESETIKKLRLLNITILPKNIGKLIFIFTEMIKQVTWLNTVVYTLINSLQKYTMFGQWW